MLPPDEILIKKNKIKIDNNISTSELGQFIRQKPNPKFFGIFRLYDWIYLKNSQGKQTKVKKWLRETVGEEPVLLDSLLLNNSCEQLLLYMQTKGYYGAKVEHSGKIKRKKATVVYTIHSGKPHIIDTIMYSFQDNHVSLYSSSIKNKSLLESQQLFDADVLLNERRRITEVLKNNGFYFFNEEYITFDADTISYGDKKVGITIVIHPPSFYGKDRYSQQSEHSRHYIDKTNIKVHKFLINKDSTAIIDTISINESVQLTKPRDIKINPKILMKLYYIKNKNIYTLNDVIRTRERLSQIPYFKNAIISFQSEDSIKSIEGTIPLQCNIVCYTAAKQAYSFEIEGTNTGGDWGAQSVFSYYNRNLFRGLENFSFKISGSMERNRYLDREAKDVLFNTIEYGVSAETEFPQFMVPFISDRMNRRYVPKTIISIGYKYQRIPFYKHPIRYITYTYRWRASSFLTYGFAPININGVRYDDKSPEFFEYIKRKYFFKYSYEDYFIASSIFSMIWNEQGLTKKRDFNYMKFTAEAAGNMLYGLFTLWGKEKEEGSFKAFNTRFAQYLKVDYDVRHYYKIGERSQFVWRFYTGTAIPYGNNNFVPNIKRYYTGGSNSMRAWFVNSLGPGSYRIDDSISIVYSLGDIKLEGNIEHRFPLFWLFEGAFFVDAGNIWTFSNLENKKGGEFIPWSFYKDIAVGAGTGVRMNFGFFVLRFDWGLKLRIPALPDSQKWITQRKKISPDDSNFTIAIGYPF
ncbi:MAG: BamA/TamA family outer membrane protein [Bacteroidales bacterium]